MNRLTIIILIVILVALIGVGVWWWLNQEDTTPSANTNLTTNQSVNSATRLEGGSLVVEKQTTYQSTPLSFTTALEDTSFHSVTADEGKKYFVVFFDPVAVATGSELPGWLNTEVSLVTGDGQVYTPLEIKAVTQGTTAAGDQGYFWFTVSGSAQDYSLKFGLGDGASTLDLGI